MTAEATETDPRLVQELERIRKWKEDRLASHQRYLSEIDEEDANLRKKLAELERKLDANNQLRDQVLSQLRKLPREEAHRSHQALMEGLERDRVTIVERAQALHEREDQSKDLLERKVKEPEVAQALEEYEKFREMEPTLANLPESYRNAIEQHHAQVKERLAEVFRLSGGSSVTLDAPTVPFSLVASVDPEEGAPAAFALLVPVPYETYKGWGEREEDLCSYIAYRAVSLVTRLLARLDAAGAPVAYREFAGCLSIQVWLGDHAVRGNVRSVVEELFEQLAEEAPELASARLVFEPVWVSPYTIAPDEEDGDSAAERMGEDLEPPTSGEPSVGAPPPTPVPPGADAVASKEPPASRDPSEERPSEPDEEPSAEESDQAGVRPVRVVLRRGSQD